MKLSPQERERATIAIYGLGRRLPGNDKGTIRWIHESLGVPSGLARDCSDHEIVLTLIHLSNEIINQTLTFKKSHDESKVAQAALEI